MRPKAYFLCALTQVIGWIGPSATPLCPSSSGHDYNCVPGVVTSELHHAQPRRHHLNGARRPWVRPKVHFRCAPTQVIGWVGSSATTPRNSSGHDYNCLPDVATSELHRAQPRRHLHDARRPWVRPKAHFRCAPTQVIGWIGSPATTPRPSSAGHDYNCLPDVVTSELHHAQPRRHLHDAQRP